ncbi:hypothetical protein ABDB91_02585 [Desulfoscipio sp. XC116]|uniref:hypothetical protein n=1 Tax=Desulfoscipio sp. XC116 TaxID=3144975 RepID=UPI00325AC254
MEIEGISSYFGILVDDDSTELHDADEERGIGFPVLGAMLLGLFLLAVNLGSIQASLSAIVSLIGKFL